MSQAGYGIAITADDKTAKGVASAEKRIGKIPKHASAVNRSQERAARESVSRNSRGILRTIGAVEQASARVFGGSSITAGFATRMGAVREAAAATGTGLGEAAAGGSLLSTSLGVVGVAAGATVGVLAAAAYAAFKLADGWAKGAASIGHTADIIGVASKEMQEFAAASERMGVDKGTATSGIGGLSQSLNDAKYGRNQNAMAVLTKLGIKLKTNSDGTVDVAGMLPAIADAVAAQNSSGRRTVMRALGMSEALIPVMEQGGKALSADMADAGNTAYVATPGDIAKGQRIARKGAMVGQLKDRAMAIVGSTAADVAEPGYDLVLSGGRQILGGATTFGGVVKNTFAPAAAAIERGGRAIDRAASRMGGGGLRGGTLRLSGQDVVDLEKTVATEWDGRSTAQLGGIVDTILNRLASGHWGKTIAGVVNARSQFSDVNGAVAWKRGRNSVDDIPMSRVSGKVTRAVQAYLVGREGGAGSSVGDNLNYANPNFSDRRNLKWINRLAGPTLGSGNSIHRHGTTDDLQRYRPGAFAVDTPLSVKVDVELHNAPPGTKAKASAGRGGMPNVSYALSH